MDMRRMMSRKRIPLRISFCELCPVSRRRTTIGSKRTWNPALAKASALVVDHEYWFGSRCSTSSITLRRIARNPDVRSRIGMPTR